MGLSIFLYLASMRTLSGLLFLIIGIIFGCYVLNIFRAISSIRNLKIVELPTLKTTEKEKASVAVVLRNLSSSDIGMIDLVSPYGDLLKIGTIPGKSNIHISPEVTFNTRGIYRFSQLDVRSAYPFGLVQYSRKISQDGEFIVFPAIYDCPSPPAAGYGPMVGGGYTGRHKSMSGGDYSGIRPMQPGDPVKYIHWKSSSKGTGIMVKEFNEELSGRISFILDCSPALAENGEKVLDWAARCTGSLIFSALDKGHHTELVDLGSLELLSIPPYSDGDMILEALARTVEKEGCMNINNFEKAVSMLPVKSSLCLVLGRFDVEIGNYIHNLIKERRVVSIYLPAGAVEDSAFPSTSSVKYYDNDHVLVI